MTLQLSNSASSLNLCINPSSSTLFQLPEEILSDIYVNVVFERTNSEISWPLPIPFMEQDVRTIYRRLYILMSVCRSWKDVALARSALWSVIPMITDPSEFTDRPQPFQLSLQRARGSKLHLSIAQPLSTTSALTEVLTEYGARLNTIELRTNDTNVIQKAIDTLLQYGTPGILSELSFLVSHINTTDLDPNVNPGVSSPNASFATFPMSLSIFRLCGVNIRWDTMAFSDRLVELHIEDVLLGYDTEIITFLQAISSASELRDLKIITVVTLRDPNRTLHKNLPSAITFPKLRTLLLIDLHFNTLEIFILMLAPSPHQISLSISFKSTRIACSFYNGEVASHIFISDSTLIRLLEGTLVDTLVVFRNGWWYKRLFHRLLKAIPAVKTLQFDDCRLSLNDCSYFERSIESSMKPQDSLFPALENLYITRSEIYFEALEKFKQAMASHPIRKVVLGVVDINHVDPTGECGREPLQESSDLVKWLGDNISEVHVNNREPHSLDDDRPWRGWY